MRMFEPGLCSVTFRSLSVQAVIDLAAANGIRAIEWGADIHVPSGDLANARDVAARTAKAGLVVSSYGSYIFAPDFSPEDMTAVLETAKALGSRPYPHLAGPAQTPLSGLFALGAPRGN